MDASNNSTPPPGNTDAVNASSDSPPQSHDRTPATIAAQQRIMKTGGVGSPVRRSPRLSCLPPPQPPIGSHDSQDLDESSDDESESVNDVALHLSRDETPENDDLPSDEPSSVLANRIIRAHDNPSPPPQDLAHLEINYAPGKDGHFPLASVSVPPSAFRSINLLERLNQFSNPLFDPPHSPGTPPLGVPPDIPKPGIIPPRGFISAQFSSPFITSVPMESTTHWDLTSADTISSSSAQCTADGLSSRSSQHLIAGPHGQLITIANSPESKVLGSPPTQAVDRSLNPVVPSASDDRPRRSLLRSRRRHSISKSSPLPPNAVTLSSSRSNENGKTSPATGTIVLSGRDYHGVGVSSVNSNGLPFSQGELECEYRRASTKEVVANSVHSLDHISPHSTEALTRLCLPLEPASSVEQTILPAESINIQHPLVTPPRTPTPFGTHPDVSQTSVQRSIIASTPVRTNSPRKLNSPSKLSLGVDDNHRTPAQRVPIETALACANASLQRTAQLSTGPDQSRPGRFLTIRAPVFTRPALDDPSRSPAKRIPITDSIASPTRGYQTRCSPTRLDFRARSASVEPRPFGSSLARSRSVEPSTTIAKLDNHGKIKESIFPIVPILPRAGTKLPFPLIPGQKSSSDLPPPIPEGHENTETENIGTDATLGRPAQSNTISQLKQPPTSSRIPRIGSKPYARPSKNGKTTVSTTTDNTVRVPTPFQLACKNSGVEDSNAEVSSTKATNGQRLVGPLKRKRGAEGTGLPNPHPVMVRQVLPGILSEKYAPKPAKLPSQVQAPAESSPPKPQPLKFRKVVDGMLSARYAPVKANPTQTELSDSTSHSPSPLSELSSLSDEGSSDEKLLHTPGPPACPKSKTSDNPQTNVNTSFTEPSMHEHSLLQQDADGDKPSGRPRRTSRARKPAQQQYVLDVFSGNATIRPPPARRRPQPRTEGDCFMGMSATALKALTTSNTTKNQQTVAVLAMEVIRKEGLRPESPAVKARTVLQKQRDERDTRRRERAQKKAKMSVEGSGSRDLEGQSELDDGASLGTREDHDENDCDMAQKHHRGPGDGEDYKTPERPERVIEPLRLEGVDRKVKPMKQVKWYRGLSTAVYLDEVDPKPKSIQKDVVVRGCLAPTSKNLPLDSLGNLVDMDSRPFPEPVMEHIVVKRFLYDNDIEPKLIPAKVTRSRSKKSKT